LKAGILGREVSGSYVSTAAGFIRVYRSGGPATDEKPKNSFRVIFFTAFSA